MVAMRRIIDGGFFEEERCGIASRIGDGLDLYHEKTDGAFEPSGAEQLEIDFFLTSASERTRRLFGFRSTFSTACSKSSMPSAICRVITMVTKSAITSVTIR